MFSVFVPFTHVLQTNESMFSIASDITMTKNMVHTFVSVKVFFISADWTLQEHVLYLHPLDGNHTGKSTGLMIVWEIEKQGVLSKFCKFIIVTLSMLLCQFHFF